MTKCCLVTPYTAFQVAGRLAFLVVPKDAAHGNPWVWRARFPGYHDEMDVELVGKGFRVANVDVAGMFGSPKAVTIGDAFYEYLTTKHCRHQSCGAGSACQFG